MRIVHLCLACFYIDEYNYQENILPRLNKEDGHDVLILASTETYKDNDKLFYLEPSEYITEYGVPIKRLPYVRIFNHYVSSKLRKYLNLYNELEKFSPDVIMSHDICFWSVLDVVKYKRAHPSVVFYADTHTAEYNSGQSWISKNVLHRIIYRKLIKKARPYLNKYFYIGIDEKKFSIDNYKVPENIMEFYPLGGIIPKESEYVQLRSKYRKELGIEDNQLLFVISGKLDRLKKADELIHSFSEVNNLDARLVVIGSIPADQKDILNELILNDIRVKYIGWVNSEDLRGYLCACDLYCQPGSPSATLQNAICCMCPIMAFPHNGYKAIDNGNFIWVQNKSDIVNVFRKISNAGINLSILADKSKETAHNLLDYNKLASRLYGRVNE